MNRNNSRDYFAGRARTRPLCKYAREWQRELWMSRATFLGDTRARPSRRAIVWSRESETRVASVAAATAARKNAGRKGKWRWDETWRPVKSIVCLHRAPPRWLYIYITWENTRLSNSLFEFLMGMKYGIFNLFHSIWVNNTFQNYRYL